MENTISQPMETNGIYGTHTTEAAGIAGLNIVPEVPVMTMFRHIIFGAVIGIYQNLHARLEND
jgi:hypothetical protein